MASNWDRPVGARPLVQPEPQRRDLSSSSSVELAQPPLAVLGAAVVAAVFGFALLFVTAVWADVVGYVAAGIVVPILVSLYRWLDQRQREKPAYSPVDVADRVAIALLVLSFTLVAFPHVWRLATELSK